MEEKLVLQIKADVSGVSKGVKEATGIVKDFDKELVKTSKSADSVVKAWKGVGSIKDQLAQVTEEIREQQEITLEFEQALLKANQALKQTADWGGQVKIKEEIEQLTEALKDQKLSLKQLNQIKGNLKADQQAQKSNKLSGTVLRLLDKVTKGYASTVYNLGEALVSAKQSATAAATSFKAVSAALVATGVGALIVALSLILTYWDDIEEAITGVNKKYEEQIKLLKGQTSLLSAKLNTLNAQRKTLELQGKSTTAIDITIKKTLQKQLLVNKSLLQAFETRTQELKTQYESLTVMEKLYNLTAKFRGGPQLTGFVTKEETEELAQRAVEAENIRTAIANIETDLAQIDFDAEEAIKKAEELGKKVFDAYQKKLLKGFKEREAYKVKLQIQWDLDAQQGQAGLSKKIQETVEGLGVFNAGDIELTGEIKASDQAIKDLEDRLNNIRDILPNINFSDTELVPYLKLTASELENVAKEMDAVLMTYDALASGVQEAVGGVFDSLYEQFKTGNDLLDSFLSAFLGVFEKIISTLLANLVLEQGINATKIAGNQAVASSAAVSAAATTAASTPFGAFALPALIAGALALIVGAFSKFATGGLVSGDRNIVRVNGNEMILNPMQQSTLFNMLRGTVPNSMSGTSSGGAFEGALTSEVKIKGSDLVLVLDRANRKANRFG